MAGPAVATWSYNPGGVTTISQAGLQRASLASQMVYENYASTYFLRTDLPAPANIAAQPIQPSTNEQAIPWTYPGSFVCQLSNSRTCTGKALSVKATLPVAGGVPVPSVQMAQFCSGPLNDTVVAAGQWTVAYPASFFTGTADTWLPNYSLSVMNGGTGDIRGVIGPPLSFVLQRFQSGPFQNCADAGVAEIVEQWRGDSVACLPGDYLMLDTGFTFLGPVGTTRTATARIYTRFSDFSGVVTGVDIAGAASPIVVPNISVSAGDFLIVTVFYGFSSTATSVSFGGTSFRKDIGYSGASGPAGSIWSAKFPNGVTGAVTISFDVSPTIAAVLVTRVSGLLQGFVAPGTGITAGAQSTSATGTDPGISASGIVTQGVYVHAVLATAGPLCDYGGSLQFSSQFPNDGEADNQGVRIGSNQSPGGDLTLQEAYGTAYPSGNGNIGNLYRANWSSITEAPYTIMLVPYW